MSVNFSKILRPIAYKAYMVIGLAAWVFTGFASASVIVVSVLKGLKALGVPLLAVNQIVFNFAAAAAVYILSLVIVIGVPWAIKKYMTTKGELGLTRLPSWMDIGLAPAGFIIYFIASGAFIAVVSHLIPGLDMSQAQETGFEHISQRYEYFAAFLALVVLAPVAEEILFRGYLYGKLKKYVPVWVAIIVTSILFGAVHGQWNVTLDVFVLSIVLCSLREVTGGIWAGILLHMLKNGIAFYFLFINPSFFDTIGK
jgi:CAAX protease family protein